MSANSSRRPSRMALKVVPNRDTFHPREAKWGKSVNRMRFSEFWTLAQALPQTLARTIALLAVAGCASTQSPNDRAATPLAAPAAPSATAGATPDATGIVTYDGYVAAVARSGDTVASVAQRIGISALELGAYNGLSPTHPLRSGDELVLPPRPDS